LSQKYRLGKQSKKDTGLEASRGGMYLAKTTSEYRATKWKKN
jgi:hypothetical protein